MSKIVIIGAGLSGLTAADEILSQKKDTEVIVLQAMDRVGGRTLSVNLDGAYYDLGAQWIGPQQKYAQQLAIRSKNQFVPQHCEGTKVMDLQGVRSTYKTDIPYNIGLLGMAQIAWNMWKVDRLAKTVPVADPTKCEQAVYWDSITVHSWLKDNIYSEKVRVLFQAAIRGIFGTQTNEMSFLFFLWYVNQNHGIDNLINIKNGAQQRKLMYGTQHMSKFLAEQIQKKRGKIILNTFVMKIENHKNKCVVWTQKGDKFQCDYVIIALPPANVQKIKFQPQLSTNRKFICQRNLLGTSTKAIFMYDKPYWREKGYSGQILTDCYDSAIYNTFDDTRFKENGEKQYAIVVFINGAACREWMQREDWATSIAQKLAKSFQCPQMLKPTRVQHKNWEIEDTISGSPIAFFPPGALSQIKDLRRPQGRIHWGGTQLATVSQGYMDGAIQSGKRVAKQVLQKMQSHYQMQFKADTSIKKQFWYTKIVKKPKKWFEWM